MPNNNYFNYTDQHYEFLYYLLSFAMEQYQNEYPLLSACAKELIRYILDMNDTENVVVTELDGDTLTVNDDKHILIGGTELYEPDLNPEDLKNLYCVHYDPSTSFTMVQDERAHALYLPMKKVREICGKYPSKNPIFLQHIQFLDEQLNRIKSTLQKPLKQWDENDYRNFSSHLVEDSVIDMTRSVVGERIYMGYNPKYTHSLYWYYIPDDKLESMGVRDHVRAIYLYTRLNTINICYVSNEDDDLYEQKLRSFVRGIQRMPLFFDLNDYKEKIQYAQSIMDRLVEEFRL